MSLEELQNVKHSKPQASTLQNHSGAGLVQPSNSPHERLADAIQDLDMVSNHAQNLLERITGSGVVKESTTMPQESLSSYPLSSLLHAGRDSVHNFENTMNSILNEIETSLFGD